MTMTRRAWLAGAGSLLALRRASAQAAVDVVVVGAGAAGLAAAKAVRAAGLTCTVIEARGRVGGRLHTDTSLGAPFDTGAQYIHWAERNPWKAIADGLGARLVEDEPGGPPLVYAEGRLLTDRERASRRAAFGRLWPLLSLEGGADRSFADLGPDVPPEVKAAAAAVTRLSLGEEPERVSLQDYEQLWSGDDYLLPDGYGTLVAAYATDVPVALGTPARLIDWSGPGVRVETERGTLQARAAIVTASVGVLRAGSIRFAPDLPSHHAEALDGLAMGAYTKVALALDPGRMGDLPADDIIEADAGATITYEFRPFGSSLAVAYLGGDYARQVCDAGERAAIDELTSRLAALLGSGLRGAVRGGRLADWWADPYALGSYSVARPGRLPARAALQQPLGDRVFLAGEACAGGGAMTAGGATLDGLRAAQAVLAQLRG